MKVQFCFVFFIEVVPTLDRDVRIEYWQKQETDCAAIPLHFQYVKRIGLNFLKSDYKY